MAYKTSFQREQEEEQAILQKGLQEQYRYFSWNRKFDVIKVLLSIPLYLGLVVIDIIFFYSIYTYFSVPILIIGFIAIEIYTIKRIIRFSKRLKQIKEEMVKEQTEQKETE